MKKTKCRKNKDSNEVIFAFITFKTIEGFNRCVSSGPIFFRNSTQPLQLLKSESSENSGSSSSSEKSANLVVISPFNLPRPGSQKKYKKLRKDLRKKLDKKGRKKNKKMIKKSSFLRGSKKESLRQDQNSRLPFEPISNNMPLENNKKNLDWMGNKIVERFVLKRIVFDKTDRIPPYEYLKYIDNRKYLCSNIRMNLGSKSKKISNIIMSTNRNTEQNYYDLGTNQQLF